MGGSGFGKIFHISTWGESHGSALGVVVDGCPAQMSLDEAYVQSFLDRRRPGRSNYSSARAESDRVHILSGVFEGLTEGTPISMIVYNEDQRSKDYDELAKTFRPGHADYGFYQKYGFRDYRGGGRSSGRETLSRVAAGAVAMKFLSALGIEIHAYTLSIGRISVSPDYIYDVGRHGIVESMGNEFCVPDSTIIPKLRDYLDKIRESGDSVGGVIECRIDNMPVGIGEPVFDKLSSCLAHGISSIGAVKGFEIGDGFQTAYMRGSENNDPFRMGPEGVHKTSNHSGGITGGFSDGAPVIFRAAIKPTPSISMMQETVNQDFEDVDIKIKGRHDPVIVPRAVVVVECMAAICVADLLLQNMTSRIDLITSFYKGR